MELRPARADEFDAFSTAVLSAFHEELTDDERRRYMKIHEADRSLAWFDGDAIVGTSSLFTRTLTVPGAQIPVGAVTAVAVLPTHRRRGLLTGMMRRQLENVRDAGEPVAALWASEGAIYGRFGFGVATQIAELAARRPAARLRERPAAAPALRCRPGRRAPRADPRAVRPGRAHPRGRAHPAGPVVGRADPRPGVRPRGRDRAARRRRRGGLRDLRGEAQVGRRRPGRAGRDPRGAHDVARRPRRRLGLPARPRPHAHDHVGARAGGRAAVARARRPAGRPADRRRRALGADRRRPRRALRPDLRDRPGRRPRRARRRSARGRRAATASTARAASARATSPTSSSTRPPSARRTSAAPRCSSSPPPAASPSARRARSPAPPPPSAATWRPGAPRSSDSRDRARRRRLRGMVGGPAPLPGRSDMAHAMRRVGTWMREQRLPPGERRAARSARQTEERLRRERDHDDPRARQLAAVEAERRRWSQGGQLR